MIVSLIMILTNFVMICILGDNRLQKDPVYNKRKNSLCCAKRYTHLHRWRKGIVGFRFVSCKYSTLICHVCRFLQNLSNFSLLHPHLCFRTVLCKSCPSITVKLAKPWTLGNISAMFLVVQPIKHMIKPQDETTNHVYLVTEHYSLHFSQHVSDWFSFATQ